MNKLNKMLNISGLLLAALVLSGCQTYRDQNKTLTYWRKGELARAEIEARAKAKDAADRDAVIWRLEEATVLRGAGKIEDSNASFAQAEDRINRYDEEAKVNLGKEGAAMLSNQATLPYRGRAYDGIMVNTYKALNSLQLGHPDQARSELIRAGQRRQDAIEENKKRIEKAQDAADKAKEKAQQAADKDKDKDVADKDKDKDKVKDVADKDKDKDKTKEAADKDKDNIAKATNDAKFKSQVSTNYAALDELKPYGDYENPFTVYLDGLVFMANASDFADLEHARKSFERVGSFGENKYIKADLAAMEGVQQGRPIPPTTYVIFETGCAPIRDQIRLDIPVIVGPGYVGAAFPKLECNNDYAPALTVSAGGTNENTVLVGSMDSVIGRDFKNELPTIITKTVAATLTKAAASWAANELARQAGGSTAQVITKVATSAYGVAVNIADTRTWSTLPKEFQVCRIPTPPDRKIDVSVPSGQKASVTVCDGTYNIVYVKSVSATAPLIATQFKLK
ncbi:MAG: hypothetical protein WCL11_00610 [Verrucomicrobiota bacterium]